jgi:hypothetical protein
MKKDSLRKNVFTITTFVINVGKIVSRQHQNLTGFMGCFVNYALGMKREK